MTDLAVPQNPVVDAQAVAAMGLAGRTLAEAWSRVLADPGHAPELLALAAVQIIGPRAARWARDVRESYPSADADGVARLAVRQFSRRGGVSSAFAAAAGSYAPIALLGTAAYTQAELVLHVAAAYGEDPADLARAADLLVLTRVHPDRQDADAALATVRDSDPEPGGAGWRMGRMAAAHVGAWVALRTVGRYFPGTAILVSALMTSAATETLGVRATTYYRAAARRRSSSSSSS